MQFGSRCPQQESGIHQRSSWLAYLSESVFFAKKLCGPKEGICVIHGFSNSFADITELSGVCTVLGA